MVQKSQRVVMFMAAAMLVGIASRLTFNDFVSRQKTPDTSVAAHPVGAPSGVDTPAESTEAAVPAILEGVLSEASPQTPGQQAANEATVEISKQLSQPTVSSGSGSEDSVPSSPASPQPQLPSAPSTPLAPPRTQPVRPIPPRQPVYKPPTVVYMKPEEAADKVVYGSFPLQDTTLDEPKLLLPAPVKESYGSGVVALSSKYIKTSFQDPTGSSMPAPSWFEWHKALVFDADGEENVSAVCTNNVVTTVQVPYLTHLLIEYNADGDEKALPEGTNEGYELSINGSSISIKAKAKFGVMHALVSLGQLVYPTPCGLLIMRTPINITDQPRFPYRGVLVDPPRQYLTLAQLRTIGDMLALHKFNVMHLRLSDDQAVVFAPEWNPSLATVPAPYTPKDLRELRGYLWDRGVRMVLEIDVPSHANGFIKANASLGCECPQYGTWSVPIDPTNPYVYTLIRETVKEMYEISGDRFVHLGGDEMGYACWASDTAMRQRAKEMFGSDHQFNIYKGFLRRVYSELSKIVTAERRVIHWEDMLHGEKGSLFDLLVVDKTIIQMWFAKSISREVAANDIDVIISNDWYFDHNIVKIDRPEYVNQFWREFYVLEPTTFNQDYKDHHIAASDVNHFIGGVATAFETPWKEYPDRVWPLMSAIAERLWSPVDKLSVERVRTARLDFIDYVEWAYGLTIREV